LVLIFLKIDAIRSFIVKFLKVGKNFVPKFMLGLCQLHHRNKPFLYTTLILMKKPWSDSRNLFKKW